MKNMRGFRTAVALLLVFAMVFGSALAGKYDVSEGGVYVYATEKDQTVKHGDKDEVSDPEPEITGTTTENTVTINAEAGAEANVTFDGLNIDVSAKENTPAVLTEGGGNVNIELDGDSTIKSGENSAGLQKENGGTLTIDDQDEDGGSLDAYAGYKGAGIGGGSYHDGENITINGGKITAHGADGASGIGGGFSGGDGRYITINGGEVTAAGGGTGAGIGGGSKGNGEHITITGGTVTASGCGAAGIGGGGAIGKGQDITITGGTVTANGGENSSGIGGGNTGDGQAIFIGGDAEVFVTGGKFGAGIGGGIQKTGSDVTISQSAQVSVAAGLSGGNYYSSPAAIGDGSVYGGSTSENKVNLENLYDTGKITIYDNGTPVENMKGESPAGNVKETIKGEKKCEEHEWVSTDCKSPSHCKHCGIGEGPLVHTGGTEVRGAKEATCKEEGYTGDTHCKGCGDKLVSGEKIEKDKTKHTGGTEVRGAKEATCSEEGYTGDTYCLGCGEKLVTGEKIEKDKTKHTGGTEVRGAKEATCTEEGYTGDTHCKGCGDKLVTGEKIEKDKTNHAGGTEVRDAKEATCKEEGYTGDTYCLGCGEKLVTGEKIEKDKTKHTGGTEVRGAKEATCKEEGYTGDTYCLGCGEKLVTGEKIAKLAHTEAIDKAVPATCTEAGLKEGKHCSVCGEVLVAQETVPAIGHIMTATPAVEATCETGGNTAYWYCPECGKYFGDEAGTKEIEKGSWVTAAKNHSWGEPVYVWAADFSGVTATRICANDPKHTEPETVAPEYAITKKPTTSAEGTGTYTAQFTNPAFAAQTQTIVLPKAKEEKNKRESKTDKDKEKEAVASAEPADSNELTVWDKDHVAEIVFRSDGTYMLKSPGGIEQGTFQLEGQIILTNETGRKLPIGADGTFAYPIGGLVFEFRVSAEEMDKLIAMLKKE